MPVGSLPFPSAGPSKKQMPGLCRWIGSRNRAYDQRSMDNRSIAFSPRAFRSMKLKSRVCNICDVSKPSERPRYP